MPIGPCSGYKHILSYQVKGEGGVNRIPKGIENAVKLFRDGRVGMPNIGNRHGEVFRETARAVHPHSHRILTKMPSSRLAVPAETADNMPLP